MKDTIEQRFSVTFNYQVRFTQDAFHIDNFSFAELFPKGKTAKAFFVIDQGVIDAHPKLVDEIKNYAAAYSNRFSICAAPLIVPGGEPAKNNDASVKEILKATDIHGIDRHSYIIAIGGGAVLDMVGFAAGIAHRGIRHIRIPTTVLSQNDSGMGVKNGINAYNKKNYLGTFTPPFAVLNDAEFLKTLGDRDWRSGISEAIKVALIKDEKFFVWLENHAQELAERQMEPMQELIYRCAQLHLNHIAGEDPFEMGSSRPLDFGHWSAHKLEHLSQYKVRHGEAVAIGIAMDSSYSFLKDMLTEEALERILSLLKKLGFKVYVPELTGDELLKGLEEFREHLGGELTIMLLEKIGKGVEVHQMDTDSILRAIGKLRSFEADNQQVNQIETS